MKKLVPALSLLALTAVPAVALAVTPTPTPTTSPSPSVSVSPTPVPVPTPSQCAGMTFDKTIQAGSFAYVDGTEGRDLILAGDGVVVHAKGGDDCVVVGGSSIVYGDDGKDVLVTKTGSSKLYGGSADDKLYDLAGSSKLFGEGGNDYLSAVGSDVVDGGAGTDECYTGSNGKKLSCELPKVTVVNSLLKFLGL